VLVLKGQKYNFFLRRQNQIERLLPNGLCIGQGNGGVDKLVIIFFVAIMKKMYLCNLNK